MNWAITTYLLAYGILLGYLIFLSSRIKKLIFKIDRAKR